MKTRSMKKVKRATGSGQSHGPHTNFDVFINDLPVYKKPKPPHARLCSSVFSPVTKLDVEAGELRSVLIFTFIYSKELLQPHLDNPKIKFVVVSDCRKDTKVTELCVDKKHPNLKLLYPKTNVSQAGISSFHPKLFLLKFEGFLRIVIGSGNMLEEDWNRYGNVFWQRDFPLLSDNESVVNSPFSSYLQEYIDFIMAEYGRDLMDDFLDLSLRDFRISEDMISLVSSLPGKWSHHGHLQSYFRIQQILKHNPPNVPFDVDKTKIHYVTSSLGSLNFKLLFDFAQAVFPSLHTQLGNIYNSQGRLVDLFDVIYPSRKYIAGTYFGETKAKCLFLRRMLYESFKFMRGSLKSFKGNSFFQGCNSVTPHYKIFIVTHKHGFDDDTIVYLGSHNFTQSAWGKFDRNHDNISIMNYELGILLPPKKGSWPTKERIIRSFGIQFPADSYPEDDEPFFCSDTE